MTPSYYAEALRTIDSHLADALAAAELQAEQNEDVWPLFSTWELLTNVCLGQTRTKY